MQWLQSDGASSYQGPGSHGGAAPRVQEFCEDCPGESRLVTRDPALQDNAALPAAFQRRAGDLLYAGLRDGLLVDGQVRRPPLAELPPYLVASHSRAPAAYKKRTRACCRGELWCDLQ